MHTIDPQSISHFDQFAQAWWDEDGPLKTLHQMNPARLSYLQHCVSQNFGPTQIRLEGLDVLDVGCGGGILSEPMARLGARVTGIDACEKTIEFAHRHAQEMGLSIHYQHSPVEETTGTFDVVTALEIIEHVNAPESFIAHCCARVKPGGLFILSTLNRTFKSYLLAIKVAEDLLRLVPQGTHQWQKFLRPREVHRALEKCGFEVLSQSGIRVDWMRKTMRLHPNTDINYILAARAPLS